MRRLRQSTIRAPDVAAVRRLRESRMRAPRCGSSGDEAEAGQGESPQMWQL